MSIPKKLYFFEPPPKIEVDGVFYAYKMLYFKTVLQLQIPLLEYLQEDGSNVIKIWFLLFCFY
jgi:hypothetical protein